ncbi:MAG: DUF5818 domain-containing protein [Sphingomonas fennica]
MDGIDETGTLVRDSGGFALRADSGQTIRLDLARVPVDHVEKRVRVRGLRRADGVVEADGVAAA